MSVGNVAANYGKMCDYPAIIMGNLAANHGDVAGNHGKKMLSIIAPGARIRHILLWLAAMLEQVFCFHFQRGLDRKLQNV